MQRETDAPPPKSRPRRRGSIISFGKTLKQARESRGISLSQIAQATKIGTRYLDALERDDFDSLPPGEVFIKGYLRAYAQHVGMDPDATVDHYLRERASRSGVEAPDEQAVLRELSRLVDARSSDRRSRARVGLRLALLLGVAVVVLVSGAAWFRLRGSGAPEATTPAGPALDPLERSPITEAPPSKTSPPESSRVTESREPPVVTAGATAAEPVPARPPAPRTAATDARAPGVTSRPEERAVLPAAAAPASRPAPTSPSRLTIPDHGVGTGVVHHRLTGRGERFEEGTAVWFWTLVIGGRRGDRIRHVWLREGLERGSTELRLGGAHWRTQSRHKFGASAVGRWSVEARDAEGRVIARQEFDCVERSGGR